MGMDVSEGIAYNPTPEVGGGTWMKVMAFNLCGGPRHGAESVSAFSPVLVFAKCMDARTVKKILIEIESLLMKNLGMKLAALVRNIVYDHDRAEDLAMCDFFFHKLPGEHMQYVYECILAEKVLPCQVALKDAWHGMNKAILHAKTKLSNVQHGHGVYLIVVLNRAIRHMGDPTLIPLQDGESESARLRRACLIADRAVSFILKVLDAPYFDFIAGSAMPLEPKYKPPPFTIRDHRPPTVENFRILVKNMRVLDYQMMPIVQQANNHSPPIPWRRILRSQLKRQKTPNSRYFNVHTVDILSILIAK
ncbi:hypothetical protein CYMTET_7019 [Cymbomonas tetramitiformis]|uniref:Uncharacterized protein n=1 Tax=Cymbomonas tetramitiformis TaxID=36881 RepID=A0AAE0LHA8_9CHLO|nr:hypothetical protein CYMTET_7019 [Cymbomonas tetramitiformis]